MPCVFLPGPRPGLSCSYLGLGYSGPAQASLLPPDLGQFASNTARFPCRSRPSSPAPSTWQMAPPCAEGLRPQPGVGAPGLQHPTYPGVLALYPMSYLKSTCFSSTQDFLIQDPCLGRCHFSAVQGVFLLKPFIPWLPRKSYLSTWRRLPAPFARALSAPSCIRAWPRTAADPPNCPASPFSSSWPFQSQLQGCLPREALPAVGTPCPGAQSPLVQDSP